MSCSLTHHLSLLFLFLFCCFFPLDGHRLRDMGPFPMSAVRVNISSTAQLNISNDYLIGLSGWVSISWSDVYEAGAFDFIAAFSPPPSSLSGFSSQLPVKYFNLTAPGPSGSIDMFMLSMRADYAFAYFQGSIDSPVLISVCSRVLRFDSYAYAANVHLARTVDPTQMRVTWATDDSQQTPQPIVMYWKKGSTDVQKQSGITTTYNASTMCGGLASNHGYRSPGLIHTAVMLDLEPSTPYTYMVGDASTPQYWSMEATFYSAPDPSVPIDLVVFGDLGQAQFDGSVGWEEWVHVNATQYGDIDEPASLNTTKAITNDLQYGLLDATKTILLHNGDISYGRGRAALWEQFFHQISPISTQIPYMVGIGNHERDYENSGGLWQSAGTVDSQGECGIPYASYFPMQRAASAVEANPTISFHQDKLHIKHYQNTEQHVINDSPWYSIEHGNVHITFISTEHAFDSNSSQYAWLAADLASVDRKITPWIMVLGHRPMYVSSPDHSQPSGDTTVAEMLRKQVEELFEQYQVDVAWWAHHHTYQRSCQVYQTHCVDMSDPNAPFGTLHIVSGAAGQWQNVLLEFPLPNWLEYYYDTGFGYSRLHALAGSMEIEFVRSADGAVLDSLTMVKTGVANRSIVVVNQSNQKENKAAKQSRN